MMQFLMSRLQASAISWSSFSACRNSRGLPTETARREAVHGRADSIGRTYQDDSERSSRRKANEAETGRSQPAHKLQTRPPGKGPRCANFYVAFATFVGIYPAWVICPPPKFAPPIGTIITLYDTLLQVAVDKLGLQFPA